MFKKNIVPILIVLILLIAGVIFYFFFNDLWGPEPKMGLPPDGFATNANSMSFQFEAKNVDSILLVNKTTGTEIDGVLNDDVFYLFDLPLLEGDNILEAKITLGDGTVDVKRSTVKVEDARPLVYLSPCPSVGDIQPLEVKLVSSVDDSIEPAKILIDLEGDGIIDSVKRFKESISVSYQKTGKYAPIVTILTKNGWLFSSNLGSTPRVILLPAPVVPLTKKYVSVGNDITDLDVRPAEKQIYVLSAADKAVYIYNQIDGSLAAKVDLPGVEGPRGMGLDKEANIYIADTGNRQILKLVAVNGYQPDQGISPEGTFGYPGINKGAFKSPEDVAVCEVEGEEKIFVADTGNDRIQRFDKYGGFEMMFNGSTAPEGELENPKGIICQSGAVIATDYYNGKVRFFSVSGDPLFSFGSSGSGTAQLKNPNKISIDGRGFYVVADTGNNRIHLIRPNGSLYRSINTPDKMPLAGITEQTLNGWELFVAAAGDSDLSQFAISDEMPGKKPGDTVQAFMDALAGNDISGARQYVAEQKQADYDVVVQDSAELQRIIQEIGQVQDLKENWVQGNDSSVSVFIQGGQVELEFLLEKNPITDEWELVIF